MSKQLDHEWECIDCGVTGKTDANDPWGIINDTLGQHGQLSPGCNPLKARIMPMEKIMKKVRRDDKAGHLKMGLTMFFFAALILILWFLEVI